MFTWLKAWLFGQNPLPLQYMRVKADQSDENPVMLQFFTWDCLQSDKSWWKHFEEQIPRLVEFGVTQVWLPPPNKAAAPNGRGYDAYDLWDLGEFAQKGSIKTRWGTREEYLRACTVAQQHGIDVLIDAVLNHKLGGDRAEEFQAVPVRSDNRLKDTGSSRIIKAWTGYDFAGRGNKYSAMRWTQEHFTGVDWDDKTKTNAIYRISSPGHKGWSRNVDRELGNYDYLLGMDIDHRHPAVQEDLLNWGQWILETTGATGFRLDAIKHIDRKFMLNWIQETRRRAGMKNMFVVSEYWSGSLKLILPYLNHFKGETAFFDVPLHMNFNRASRERTRYDLRNILSGSIVQCHPNDAVTFVDNHDTVEGQSLESWVGENFKVQAYALILLRGYGLPCVFYGDVYPNKEYRETVSKDVLRLMQARKRFGYGTTEEYPAHHNCIGFVRKGDASHAGCAVLLSNREEGSDPYVHELRMNVGIKQAGSTFGSFMTKHGVVEIDAQGWGTFTCFASMVQVWVRLEELPESER